VLEFHIKGAGTRALGRGREAEAGRYVCKSWGGRSWKGCGQVREVEGLLPYPGILTPIG
jgi:hypothetical protein